MSVGAKGHAFIYIYINVIVMYVLFCIFYFHCAIWHSLATLTEVLPCFFSVVRQMPGYNSQRWGTAYTLPKYLIMLFCVLFVLFVCKCVLYYCHWVSSQLQLTNIYHEMTTIQNLQLSGQHVHRMFIILCVITKHLLIFRQQSRKTS